MPQRKTNKPRVDVTIEQKLEYVKLMIDEGYSNKKVMEISGASESFVSRWKRQYVAELKGHTPEGKKKKTGQVACSIIKAFSFSISLLNSLLSSNPH